MLKQLINKYVLAFVCSIASQFSYGHEYTYNSQALSNTHDPLLGRSATVYPDCAYVRLPSSAQNATAIKLRIQDRAFNLYMLIQGSVDSRNVFTGDETSSFAVSNIPRCCCSDLHYTVQQSLKEIVLLGKDLVAPEQRDDATQIINVINLAVWNTITPLFGDPHIDLLVNMITGTVRTNVLSRIRAHTASCPDQFDVSNQS